MTTEKVSLNNICSEQLLNSLAMYNSGNYISAITLAGAAEEILGKIIKEKGLPNTYDLIKGLINNISYELNTTEYTKKEFNSIANTARNKLKHYCSACYVELDVKQESVNIIHRAIHNYQTAIGALPEEAKDWLKNTDTKPKWPIKQE